MTGNESYIRYNSSFFLIDGSDYGIDIMLSDDSPAHGLAEMLESGLRLDPSVCTMVRDVEVFIHGPGAEDINCDGDLSDLGVSLDRERGTISLDSVWKPAGREGSVRLFRSGALRLETTIPCLLRGNIKRPRRRHAR